MSCTIAGFGSDCAGVVFGTSLSGVTFSVVAGVLGRAFPPEKRSMVLGISAAAGSFGQFAMLPFTQLLMTHLGWHGTLIALSGVALLMAPMMLTQIPGTVGRVRPAFNVVISNVPGPKKPLYFRGFRMEAYYPLSIPLAGYGLNITVVSYVDTLNFGFIGCRDTLPHLQRLAVYSREALEELEAAAA